MKDKGFTLTEILGVIVILGLLLLLVAPTLTNKLSSMSTKTNEAQNNTIYEATEQYMTDNSDIYPKTNGNIYCISLEELIDSGNLPEGMVDVTTREKYDTNTQVKVKIDENGNADYEITSGNDSACVINAADVLSVEVNPGNKTWSSKKMITIKYPTLDVTNDTERPNCYIKDNEQEVCTSKSTITLEFTNNGNITAYVKVNEDKVTVKDNAGNKVNEIKMNVQRIDRTPPTCQIEVSGKTNGSKVLKDSNSIWYTGDITIKATYDDGTESSSNSGLLTKTGLSPQEYKGKGIYNNKMGGEVQKFTQTSTQSKDTNGTTWYCYAKDKAGNEVYNKYTLYKDSQPPVCEISFSGNNKGSQFKNSSYTNYIYYNKNALQKNEAKKEQWYTGNVKVSLSYNDINKDGIASGTIGYSLLGGSIPKDVSSSNAVLTQSKDTKGTTYYGLVMDEAGNTSSCSRTVFKDATAPNCTLKQSATTKGNLATANYYWWTSGNVAVSFASSTDSVSGIKSKGVTTSTTPSYTNATGSQTYDTKGTTWYGYVMDNAGNTNKCNTVIYRDTKKPTCEITSTGTKGNNDWYIDDVTIGLTTNDVTSDIGGTGISTDNVVNYNNITELKLTSDTSGTTYYGFVKDKAGNTSTCSKTIKRNTTPPSCNLTSTGTKGNNDWYRGNITITLNYDTNAPATITEYGITSENKETYNNKKQATQTADTKGVIYYGFVKDAAGRTAKCETPTLKKDGTKPKLSYELLAQSGERVVGRAYNNQWCDHIVRRILYPSDTTSGVARVEMKDGDNWINEPNVEAYDFNNRVDDHYYRVIDNAGNVSNNLHLIVKSDWEAPYVGADVKYDSSDGGHYWGYCYVYDDVSGANFDSWNKIGTFYYDPVGANCSSTAIHTSQIDYYGDNYYKFRFDCGSGSTVHFTCNKYACDYAGNCSDSEDNLVWIGEASW